LDENTYELENDMLVIADNKKAVAIAGVMGGSGTAVHDNTPSGLCWKPRVLTPVAVPQNIARAGVWRSESSGPVLKRV